MKKHKTLIIIIALVLIAAITVGIEIKRNAKTPYEGDITSFKYNYNRNGQAYFNSEIVVNDKLILLTVKEKLYRNKSRNVAMRLFDTNLEELRDLINDNKIYEWDGFDAHSEHPKELVNFSLEVHYSDGRTLTAKGSGPENFPEGYNDGAKALYQYLDKLASRYSRGFNNVVKR